jgi:AraC-like DNA-binding protein
VAADLLVFDPIAAAALDGGEVDHSERSVQRRVARATGLSRRLIAQIERAEAAAAMLMNGSSIGDVVSDLRYADQAHLTRSVRRFIGQTPSEIVRSPAPA